MHEVVVGGWMLYCPDFIIDHYIKIYKLHRQTSEHCNSDKFVEDALYIGRTCPCND